MRKSTLQCRFKNESVCQVVLLPTVSLLELRLLKSTCPYSLDYLLGNKKQHVCREKKLNFIDSFNRHICGALCIHCEWPVCMLNKTFPTFCPAQWPTVLCVQLPWETLKQQMGGRLSCNLLPVWCVYFSWTGIHLLGLCLSYVWHCVLVKLLVFDVHPVERK